MLPCRLIRCSRSSLLFSFLFFLFFATISPTLFTLPERAQPEAPAMTPLAAIYEEIFPLLSFFRCLQLDPRTTCYD